MRGLWSRQGSRENTASVGLEADVTKMRVTGVRHPARHLMFYDRDLDQDVERKNINYHITVLSPPLALAPWIDMFTSIESFGRNTITM